MNKINPLILFAAILAVMLFCDRAHSRSAVSIDTAGTYLPDFLPHLDDGAYLCGTTVLLGIPEIRDIQSNWPDLSAGSPLDSHDDHATTQAGIFPESYAVGDTLTFKVLNFEESNNLTQQYDDIEFKLMAIGELAEIWVEIDELGPDKIDQDVVEAVMTALEDSTPAHSFDSGRGIIDISRELFGNPPDVDGSGRVKVLLVDIRDGWDPETGGGYIAGFFNPVDLSRNPIHLNSNRADIIYIDTYPGIYREETQADASRPLNVVAHEYQHLIHANYGNLITFQNEAQSEIAEVLTGFSARRMRFLENDNEISGNVSSANGSGLYRWRRSDINQVLYDYQRAGLLHGYLNERFGAAATGSVTQSASFGRDAYAAILEQNGMDWETFLSDFYTANLLNDPDFADGRFGYSQPQFSGVGVRNSGIAARYNGSEGLSLQDREVILHYGGAKYTQWQNVENLQINLENDEGLRFYYVARNTDGMIYADKLGAGSIGFHGSYESITLIAVNVLEHNEDEMNPGSRSYTYSTGEANYSDEVVTVAGFKLIGNFPNPFNPSTVIRFTLPERNRVRIDIFDLQGRKLTTLVDEIRDAGLHNEVFYTDELSSGIYIYRVTAGGVALSGKMMLVR